MHLPWTWLALGGVFAVLAAVSAGRALGQFVRVMMRVAIGFAVVSIADTYLARFGFSAAANPITGAIVGFLGVPGFVLVAMSGRILG